MLLVLKSAHIPIPLILRGLKSLVWTNCHVRLLIKMLMLGTWLPEALFPGRGEKVCPGGTSLLGIFKGIYPFLSGGSIWCLALQPEQPSQETEVRLDGPALLCNSENGGYCLNLHISESSVFTFVNAAAFRCFKFQLLVVAAIRPAVCAPMSTGSCIHRECPMSSASAVKAATQSIIVCVYFRREGLTFLGKLEC